MKVLKFSYVGAPEAKAGRELLADVNARALRDLFGDDLWSVTVDASSKATGLRSRLKALSGWLNGLDSVQAHACAHLIRREGIDAVYLEGSNYGRLARLIHKAAPSCRIVTFFHNCEARFFWGALKSNPSAKAIGVLLANWFAERLAVKYSHRIICLNERDSAQLQRLYGRGATDIHPMCVDRLPCPDGARTSEAQRTPCGLFVGSSFYANVAGMRWFATHVSPRLACNVYVVGKGFEQFREEFKPHPNVCIIGAVESVEEWYQRCTFVVAPIFDGSGMKTKVAEALMYGKPVVGTREAFIGYEPVAERAGYVCDTPEDFAAAVNSIHSRKRVFDSRELEALYASRYSYEAKRANFSATFDALVTASDA